MNREITAEESRQECIRVMGDSLGELYHYLWQELVWLYSKWLEFVELYGSKPSRIDLMNETAPYFFRIVQDVLLEDVILGISRITDSPKSLGKDNLTIYKIPDLITDEKFKKKLSNLNEDVRQETSFCRDWRNRRLAHNDFLLTTNRETKELEFASHEKIKKALLSISKVLNEISLKYFRSTTAFEFNGGTLGNAVSLLYVIYDGLKANKERKNRMDKGEEREDDFNYPDL